jgi:hypothetical protein
MGGGAYIWQASATTVQKDIFALEFQPLPLFVHRLSVSAKGLLSPLRQLLSLFFSFPSSYFHCFCSNAVDLSARRRPLQGFTLMQ